MIFSAYRYVWHWLYRVDAHSLHSPLLFDFYNKVIRPSDIPPLPEIVKTLLDEAGKDSRLITRQDLGAGSKAHGNEVKVATLARHSTSSATSRQLLYNLIRWKSAENVLELGTSLGFTTMTMASAQAQANVHSIEGCPQTAEIAREYIRRSGFNGISVYQGEISKKLPEILSKMGKVDLAYLDANHRYEPTISYFSHILPYLHEGSIIVIGDISWSKGMQKAWKEIARHPRVTASVDLLEAGALFFQPLPHRIAYAIPMPGSKT